MRLQDRIGSLGIREGRAPLPEQLGDDHPADLRSGPAHLVVEREECLACLPVVRRRLTVARQVPQRVCFRHQPQRAVLRSPRDLGTVDKRVRQAQGDARVEAPVPL